jgi:hypothetical protein
MRRFIPVPADTGVESMNLTRAVQGLLVTLCRPGY